MNTFVSLFVFVLYVSSSFADQCGDKITDIQTNVAYDAKLNLETVYTVQFKAQCGRYAQFFAVVDGAVLTSSSSESGDLFQFSWTESHKTAKTGEIKLRVFDEEGFVAYKKAQRNNEDLTKVKETKEISFYHKGSYRGFFIQTEVVVVILACLVFYFAQDERSKIQA